jgi:hypothetical protein
VKQPATQGPDGAVIEWPDAQGAWAVVAREELIKAAGAYGSVVSYKELAAAVQEQTGIQTRSLVHNWIGGVLRAVTDAQAGKDEPLLTSLVVRADETIGVGFAEVAEERDGAAPEDIEQRAAEERLACYRFFGATVPDGAQPALTPKVKLARLAEHEARRAAEPVKICPTCFVRLPRTGQCDACND